jgi:Dyp-type peroxidase family
MRAKVNSIELGGATNLAVLAPIKPGFVEGFETITFLERLHKLLTALFLSRQAQREAATMPTAFPDSIGRFGIIRSFRYAIFPPYPPDPDDPTAAPPTDPHWLTLNVTFDGGWEPYMRVIYRDIGTLLDALFSNCVGYPGSRRANFDEYCRWVRRHELPGGVLYTDSPVTMADHDYLVQLERIHREESSPRRRERRMAALALPGDPARDAAARKRALTDEVVLPVTYAALRSIKGLYRLLPYFPPNRDEEHRVLWRFAQQVLVDFRANLPKLRRRAGKADAIAAQLQGLLGAFADELAWFDRKPDPHRPLPDPVFDPAAVQAGIVTGHPDTTHGCLVMCGVAGDAAGAARAAAFLAGYAVSVAGREDAGGIRRNVALSFGGLKALGVHPLRIDKLAPEFAQGMEARAGLLGDLYGNHPDNWKRPRRNWQGGARRPDGAAFDLSIVDVVIALRLSDFTAAAADLHAALEAEVRAIEAAAGGGLQVLRVEAMRSNLQTPGTNPREHFGFLDGFSQPVAVTPPPARPAPNEVRLGELLTGFPNSRGDSAEPAASELLLHQGSFLVVRKLRQHLDALQAVLATRPDPTATLERMVGRSTEGRPLVPGGSAASNDFDYRKDPQGSACPFHSHVRRTNPRDGRAALPRIARRGMSYGPSRDAAPLDADRGIIFMAHCASIAEQFEVIQRWIAGGNSTGVSSAMSDPLLGTPVPGQRRTLRGLCPDGSVERVDLGDKPFVSLQWGLYLFAPSVAALRALSTTLRTAPADAAPPPPPAAAPASEVDAWRRVLEDPELAPAAWQRIRQDHGDAGQPTAYGRLVGTAAGVLAVLQDDGRRHSVCGYAARMTGSIGPGFLGQDGTRHAIESRGVNEAIAAYRVPEVFRQARPIVDGVVAKFVQLAAADPSGRVPIDLMSMAERVLALLCTAWFGLPDGALMTTGGRQAGATAPPRCPGHLLTVSRHVFSPRPSDAVVGEGRVQGAAVLEAVERMLAEQPPQLGPLARAVKAAIDANPDVPAADKPALTARTLAGVMLGFPPTVYGNFLRVMASWQADRTDGALWTLQCRLSDLRDSRPDALARAREVLESALLETMAQHPVPDMIWRTDREVPHADPARPEGAATVVLGLGSAMQEPGADHMLIFGGDFSGTRGPKTPHACPGYEMAMGVLLALTSGLLEAGTLRPTGSPIALTLIP